MNRLKTFFYVLKNTFTNPSYYATILKAPFSFSLKFFLVYQVLFALITVVIFGFVALKPFSTLVNNAPAILIESYPPRLEVTVKNGEVSTNVKEPYAIPLRSVEKVYDKYTKDVKGAASDNITNLVVIDTKGRIEDFRSYQTVMLVTKRHITTLDDNGKIQTMELNNVSNLVINKKVVEKFADQVRPFLGYVIPTLSMLLFLFIFLFFTTGRLMYLIFGAACLLVSAKLMSYPLTYKKSYQMGLHLVVVTGTLFGVLSLLQVPLQYPFLYTSVFVLIGVLILNSLKRQGAPPREVRVTVSLQK